jgi:hypothetical protein
MSASTARASPWSCAHVLAAPPMRRSPWGRGPNRGAGDDGRGVRRHPGGDRSWDLLRTAYPDNDGGHAKDDPGFMSGRLAFQPATPKS